MAIEYKHHDAGITLVTINFNAGLLLKDCISSALSSTLVRYVYVIDNASTDNSLSSLEAEISDTRLKVFRNTSNVGFGSANNQALKLIDTEYILLLNPDCIVSKEAIDQLVLAAQADINSGLLGPLILNEDGSEQRGCRRREPKPELLLKTLLSAKRGGINQVGAPLSKEPQTVDAISGACMLVRRDALFDVGLFDEDYFLHFEDLDWCKRFWLKGWKVLFVPASTVVHAQGACSRRSRLSVERYKINGLKRYYKKYYDKEYSSINLNMIYFLVYLRYLILAPVWLWKNRKQ